MEEILQSVKEHEQQIKARRRQQQQTQQALELKAAAITQQQQQRQPIVKRNSLVKKPPPISFDELMRLAESNSIVAPESLKASSSTSTSKPSTSNGQRPGAVSQMPETKSPQSPLQRRPSASSSEIKTRSILQSSAKIPLARLSNKYSSPFMSHSRTAVPPAAVPMVKRSVAKSPFSSDHSSLIKLNTVKRDLRTIEEIQRDLRAKKECFNGSTAPSQRPNTAEAIIAPVRSSLHKINGSTKTLIDSAKAKVDSKPLNPANKKADSAVPSKAKVPAKLGDTKKADSAVPSKAKVPAKLGDTKKADSAVPSKAKVPAKLGEPKKFGVTKKVDIPDERELDERTARKHYSAIIQELFNKGGTRRPVYGDVDDDDDLMEATAEEMLLEEKRSSRLGRIEDELEAARERQRKSKNKRRRLYHDNSDD